MYNNNIAPTAARRAFRHFDGEAHAAACALAGDSGAALKTFEAVLHRARVTKARTVNLTGDLCGQFALDRKAKARGIDYWAGWGVFTVEQKTGKNPIVTIAAVPGRIVRMGRLRRVQVASLGGNPAASAIEFNCGTLARAGRPADQRRLERLAASGEPTDAELVDRGTGWLLWELLPPSDEWRPLEITA